MSRDKQAFVPIVAGKVSMYVCGMTVYDYCHLGHARVMVVFDMISRWFRASDYDVTYVRNITDIDDKIIKRANENHEDIGQLTQRFIQAMDEDSAALGVLRPNIEPRATSYIQSMLDMISTLITKGHAYAAANGDVFFSVRSFADYGKLSGKSLDDLRAGERVEVDSFKQDALDFVLWKAAKPNEPSWDSPWGKGRPGWHIECSAMSSCLLGPHFDLHGGGQDLQFPHHENEIAQSESAYGVAKYSLAAKSQIVHDCTGESKPMANYWMHNGFVRVDDEKMSKSLGNFFTIRTVLEKYDAEVVRFFILRAHYRSPLNYSDQHLDDAKLALTRLYTALRGFDVTDAEIDWLHPQATRFKAALDDDFNTPEVMAILFDLASEVNKTKLIATAGLLKNLANVMGLLTLSPEVYLQGKIAVNLSQSILDIDALIIARNVAKKSKNFDEADRIRQELADRSIILEDNPQGTTWRRA